MASSSSKKFGLSFFKIILNSHIFPSPKLNIPLKFAREHGYTFDSEEVCLKVEGGGEWKVAIVKGNDGRVLFGKGWEEFSKFYSLAYGHFLVFRYEGKFCFHVHIFEKSCSEILYPKLDRHRRIDDDEFWFENDYVDEGDDEMLEYNVITQTLPSNANQNKSKAKGKAKVCSRNDFQDVKSGPMIESKNIRKKKSDSARSVAKQALSSYHQLTATNPSFTVIMGPAYTHTLPRKNYLNIPLSFARMYIRESKEITLQVLDGRIWRIWCGVRSWDERVKVEMRDGWKEFAKDNSLKVGDICIFELIKTTPIMSFNVIFHRVMSRISH